MTHSESDVGAVFETMQPLPPGDFPGCEVIGEMVCTCGDERLAEGNTLRVDARRILELGTSDFSPGAVTDSDFLTYAVMWLDAQEPPAHITEILTDQWSLVSVIQRRYTHGSGFEPVLLMRIQCDRVEDGIARAIQILHERARRS
jgi:hypothetical protein